ncbi:MAG: hypothetical protein RLZZ316_1946 [Bacteroidota bacterium]|jgi:dinuclear metal center YbgI/SA1388 family protein
MKISEIITALEQWAPPVLQEDYDNAGLITGSSLWHCNGVLVCLDITAAVLQEAKTTNCNLIVVHHPIIFKGLKKITGRTYIEKLVIDAIKNDIAIYAIHTNLDNVLHGVNGKIAALLGLKNISVLAARSNQLKKLFSFVPVAQASQVRAAVFAAGAGHIGNYSECSFNANGTGTFKAGASTQPYVGKHGLLHEEDEIKIEVVFPAWIEQQVVAALLKSHPYEEATYDIIVLENNHAQIGSGVVGVLPSPLSEPLFLDMLLEIFKVPVVRHTALMGRPIERVAVCGGAGSFLISKALAEGADVYITADMKYHDFFDAAGNMLIADVGHYESEQYTCDLILSFLQEKFPTFASLKTSVVTNPVKYYTGG